MPLLPRKAGRPAWITKAVPDEAPVLFCDSCEGPLTFVHSTVGGVAPIEQWDRYVCRRCGADFEYRRRTRLLRRLT